MGGQSVGTWQIYESGIAWLKQRGYTLPQSGGFVQLDATVFRYLKGQNYLYIKGIDFSRNQASDIPALVTALPVAEPASHGPDLLLQIADDAQKPHANLAPWQLIIQLDKWEEQAKNEILQLVEKKIGAVGYLVLGEDNHTSFHGIGLRHLRSA